MAAPPSQPPAAAMPARVAAALLTCAAAAALLSVAMAPLAAHAAPWPAYGGGGGGGSDGFFVRHPEAVVAPLGDEAALKCVLRFPAERLRWRKDGRLLPDPAGPASQQHQHQHQQQHQPSLPVRASELPLTLSGPEQVGAYQCVAYFGAAAQASLPGRVSLASLQPFPAAAAGPLRKLQVAEGSCVALRWRVPAGAPSPVLEIFKDGARLPELSPRARILEASGSLLLVNVTRSDSALYSAAASNYITGQRVKAPDSVQLDVVPAQGLPDEAPSFLEPPPLAAYNVSIGRNVTLECAGTGRPIPTVQITKTKGELPRGRSEKIPGGLHIWSAVRYDAGTYLCELQNRAGRVVHFIKLHVQEPPEVSRLPNMTTIQEGDNTSFTCRAQGYPAPNLTWLFNGEDIVSDDHITIINNQLQISCAEKRHAGTYQCFATNAVGDAARSVELHVAPKKISADAAAAMGVDGTSATAPPAAVAAITATPPSLTGGRKKSHGGGGLRRKDKNKHRGSSGTGAGAMIPPSKPFVTRLSDTSVMVRWDVPRNDGLPILFFKVQYREVGRAQRRRGSGGKGRGGDRRAGEGSRWMTHNEDIHAHIRSLKVDNLQPNHVYRFRVAAVYANNDNKPGPVTDYNLSRGEVGNELAAPELKEVVPLSARALQIQWEYTASPRTPAQGFYVYYRPASSAGDYLQVTVEGESEREFTLSHLEPNTAYEVKVQSFHLESASNFSNIKAQKTLPAPTEEPPASKPGGPSAGQAEANKGQLFTVLWPVLGGLAGLGVLLLAIFLCRRRRLQAGASSHQDKLSDPGLQNDAAAVFALNSKNILNGRLPQNGHHPGTKINITTNPLADSDEDKNQNVVEMSSQNNNRASADGSVTGAARSSIASDAEVDSHVDGDVAPTEVKSWRGTANAAAASEKTDGSYKPEEYNFPLRMGKERT